MDERFLIGINLRNQVCANFKNFHRHITIFLLLWLSSCMCRFNCLRNNHFLFPWHVEHLVVRGGKLARRAITRPHWHCCLSVCATPVLSLTRCFYSHHAILSAAMLSCNQETKPYQTHKQTLESYYTEQVTKQHDKIHLINLIGFYSSSSCFLLYSVWLLLISTANYKPWPRLFLTGEK